MVTYAPPAKAGKPGETLTALPWKEERGLMEKAKKNFVDPAMDLDFSAPAFQQIMNQSRGETGKTTANLIAKLAATPGMSSPTKAALMNESFGKIQSMAAGTGLQAMNQLMAFFDKITGTLGQIGGQPGSPAGGSYGINVSKSTFV
jgi:hypothetical protein